MILMVKLMRLLFKFDTEYSGPPLHIPGNMLRHALSMQLNTSVGIFTNESTLTPPISYETLFYIRTQKCFLPPHYEEWRDKVTQKKAYRCYFTPNFVTFDLIDPPANIIEIIQNKELIQFGAHRNCGFGVVTLQDSLEIDLDQIQFPDRASHLTLISPVIYLPQFAELYACRHKNVQIRNHTKVNQITTIAPGQFFRIKPGKEVQKIAKSGILRRVLLGQFGFGEFVVHNWTNISGESAA